MAAAAAERERNKNRRRWKKRHVGACGNESLIRATRTFCRAVHTVRFTQRDLFLDKDKCSSECQCTVTSPLGVATVATERTLDTGSVVK
ncbi:hypothetical protein F2P81_001147 [Scophthalmus maximus]|uniref:Uncharacterized protein n=1 Tax=Scophthalmus maximus TaxID=52904 RepID=A0A6A4TWH7_SCOMX|nr:hypothetical protein F2P81_001147 [Scophthalmus maximus]